jgi:aminopeptidase N
VRPDAKTKAEWLAKIQALPTAELPYAKLRVAMASLYPAGQEAFAEAAAAQLIESMARSTPAPTACSCAATAAWCRRPARRPAWRAWNRPRPMAGLSEGVQRDIVSALENDRRCVATRAKFEAGL